MSWFNKLIPSGIQKLTSYKKKSVPEGLWIKCLSCDAFLFHSELKRNLNVCPKCNYHLKINARERLFHFLDSALKSLYA